jgi:deoxyribonuclease-4
MIYFGPSGNDDVFYAEGNKSSVQAPAFLAGRGLNAYEYSCSKGVNVGAPKAAEIGAEAEKYGIFVSIHAPYYINMSSDDEIKRANSAKYIMQTLEIARPMKAKRIVIHAGVPGNGERSEAMRKIRESFTDVIRQADEAGLGDIAMCPELMGKMNQMGSLDEVLEMCLVDERLIPTIDFGHLHARTEGCLKSLDDFMEVFARIENVLGVERMRKIHIHMSRIEYTTGGERKHRDLSEAEYGPDYKLMIQAILAKKAEPVVICESHSDRTADSVTMKNYYEYLSGGGTI